MTMITGEGSSAPLSIGSSHRSSILSPKRGELEHTMIDNGLPLKHLHGKAECSPEETKQLLEWMKEVDVNAPPIIFSSVYSTQRVQADDVKRAKQSVVLPGAKLFVRGTISVYDLHMIFV
jgi:hypothetical protein